jgi:hypothetical protein
MALACECGILDCEIRENQKQTRDALETLFELLEEYAPAWYTEEHRQQALAALATTAERTH